MKINKLKFFSLIFLASFVLALPVLALENEEGNINFDNYEVSYDQIDKIKDDFISYYQKGKIVLTTFDTNSDSKIDLWLRYDENGFLNLEASDSDYDGQPDTFITVNQDEEVLEKIAPEFDNPQIAIKDQAVNNSQTASRESEVYVVNPPGEKYQTQGFGGFNKLIFVIILLVVVIVAIKIVKKN